MFFTENIRVKLSDIHLYTGMLLAFWLSLDRNFIPFLSFIWLLLGLLTLPRGLFRISRIRWKYVALFALFYLLYVISVSYSDSCQSAWFGLEVKLPLLFFPLFTASLLLSGKGKRVDRILMAFVAGNLLASLICIGAAFFGHSYFEPSHFHYSDLSYFDLHPSYFALYLTFSMAVLLFHFLPHYSFRHRPVKFWLSIGALLFMFIMVLLLSSRTGILAVSLLVMLKVFHFILTQKRLNAAVKTITVILVVGILSFSAYTNQRVQKLFRSVASIAEPVEELKSFENLSSSQARLYIWKSGFSLLKDHWLFGVGSGDVKSQITAKINELLDSEQHMKINFNAHNQFLDTFLAVGLPGFLILLALIIWPGIVAIRNNDWLLLSLVLILAVHLFFESMLNRQAGVVFAALFLPLLFVIRQPYKSTRQNS
ncbi:MAG: O-antigen ligase family protein [Bacteroidales bacterium]